MDAGEQSDVQQEARILSDEPKDPSGDNASDLPTASRTTLNAPGTIAKKSDIEDDDFEEESFVERLVGLTEMFPESLRSASYHLGSFSKAATCWFYGAGRTTLWVVASSACILALPVMFESERAQMEEQQMQQQRQLLLGPNAATA